jgi:prepilin-type N-terminal cleavage/methylation domain-containing protein
MKKVAGFTLIELMITIAIFAILVGIGVPSYQNTIQQNKIDNSTDLIKSAVTYGQNTALAHNRPLYMTASANTLTISTSDDNNADNIVNQITIDTDSNTSVTFNTADSPITFRANGTIAQSNTIRYCFGGSGIEIAVGINGELTKTDADAKCNK